MSYIPVPQNSTTRKSGQLRRVVDLGRQFWAALATEQEAMSQMTTAEEVEAEYDVRTGQGDDAKNLVTSTKTELEAASFFQQLISRMA